MPLSLSRAAPLRSLALSLSSLTFGAPCSSITATSFLGVTEPVSLAWPEPADLQATEALDKLLHANGLYESAEEGRRREEVLGRLDGIVRDWVRDVSARKARHRNCCCFGSWLALFALPE